MAPDPRTKEEKAKELASILHKDIENSISDQTALPGFDFVPSILRTYQTKTSQAIELCDLPQVNGRSILAQAVRMPESRKGYLRIYSMASLIRNGAHVQGHGDQSSLQDDFDDVFNRLNDKEKTNLITNVVSNGNEFHSNDFFSFDPEDKYAVNKVTWKHLTEEQKKEVYDYVAERCATSYDFLRETQMTSAKKWMNTMDDTNQKDDFFTQIIAKSTLHAIISVKGINPKPDVYGNPMSGTGTVNVDGIAQGVSTALQTCYGLNKKDADQEGKKFALKSVQYQDLGTVDALKKLKADCLEMLATVKTKILTMVGIKQELDEIKESILTTKALSSVQESRKKEKEERGRW